MSYCLRCLNLHERIVAWTFIGGQEPYGHHSLGTSISARADGGCQGCILIRTILSKLAAIDISEDYDKNYDIYTGVLDSTIRVVPREGARLNSSRTIHLFPRDDRSLLDGKPSTISGDTSSNEAFETARAWLDNCETNHTQCKTSNVLPRRILDVGEPDADDLPKLVEHCSMQRGKYACLSYCWGKDPGANIQTTKNTLAQRKSGIEWKDIPATIADAILSCRKLGIRFLWIDALCIIQDDVQDWALECANMAEIYSNSYITLAAVAAQDPTCGMFETSVADKYRSIDFNVKIAGSNETAKISAREALDHRRSETDPRWLSHSDPPPLMTRAWVLQEMLLSPRVLGFDMDELSWECREIMTCECSRMSRKSDISLIHRLSSHGCSVPDEEYFHGWRKITSSFYSRDITYESDRLPAISAIARKFEPVGGRYLAGIWEKDLFRGLLWRPWDRHTIRLPDKSAPSWSWISSQSHVTFACDPLTSEGINQFVLQEQAQVRDIHCLPATKNEFGSVQEGSITLSGRLVQVLVTCSEGAEEDRPVGFSYVNMPRPFQDVYTGPERGISAYGLRDDKILSDSSAEMYAFLLASNSAPRRYLPVHFSLLLRKVPGEKCSVVYERLGLLEEICPYEEPSAQLHWSLFSGSTEEVITII